MLHQRDLLQVTGYLHGECSPVGMKKALETVLDLSANNMDKIIFSAGKIGYQVEVSVAELPNVLCYAMADLQA